MIRSRTLSQRTMSINKSLALIHSVPTQKQIKVRPVKSKTQVSDTEPVSLRALPLAKSKIIPTKKHENELVRMGFSAAVLKSVYQSRCAEQKLKPDAQNYEAWAKQVSVKVGLGRVVKAKQLNLPGEALSDFLIQAALHIGTLDDLALDDCVHMEASRLPTILTIIRGCTTLTKLSLCNMSLGLKDLEAILSEIVKTQRITHLNLSNQTGQSLNRFGDDTEVLKSFLTSIQGLLSLKLANMSLKSEAIAAIKLGISHNQNYVLRELCLKGNRIGPESAPDVAVLMRMGVKILDLSDNKLGPKFFEQLGGLRNSSIEQLTLCNTQMNSHALIEMLSRFVDNKALKHLRLDGNDFRNHWILRIKEWLETNLTLETISMAECQMLCIWPLLGGLTTNNTLLKLDCSGNIFDCDKEKETAYLNFGSANTKLTQINMKNCGITEQLLTRFVKGLAHNTALKKLNLSGNTLGTLGSLELIGTLSTNKTLCQVDLDRTLAPYASVVEIQKKTTENYHRKASLQLQQLRQDNSSLKTIDLQSEDEIKKLQQTAKFMALQGLRLEGRLQTLATVVQTKKTAISSAINAKKHQLSQLQSLIREKTQTNHEKIKGASTQGHLLGEKLRKIEEKKVEEKTAIFGLETMIRQENMRIKQRQRDLEDSLRNQKYIQRKNSTVDRLRDSRSGATFLP